MKDDSPASLASGEAAPAPKPKRVRTGCLTCRERHLKCDEGLPNCQNCNKSGKICKRGMKLNFHWIDVKDPAILPPTADWAVKFQDESRLIASEYKGGLRQYSAITVDQTITPPHEPTNDYRVNIDPNITMHNNLPPILHQNAPGLYPEPAPRMDHNQSHSHSRDTSLQHSHASSAYLPTAPPTLYDNPPRALTPPNESREFLTDPQEVLLMQVFIEEVGLWMDSMDHQKHFSRILPFQALSEPMLLNAFLSCGARHLVLINPEIYQEHKALYYYDTATTQLMNALHNPDRDTVICALTAVILNVYEIMCERANQRMNHIAGARALIKECHWSARSTGIGAACFWLNVGMEVLSCLHFNWQTAWDPDHWGVDLDFENPVYQAPGNGNEELWVHRVLYLCAKICNFRASIPRFREAREGDEERRLRRRLAEWGELREWCERWEQCCPRSMRPLGVLWPGQSLGLSAKKSLFPEVWLIKRSSITARLFHHTCLILLSRTHPLYPAVTPATQPHPNDPSPGAELASQALHHAHQICGIVAHVKDRGVASVCLRSMAIAAEVLVRRDEQEEVMETFHRIRRETGWNIGFLEKELPEVWGWNAPSEESGINQFFNGQSGSGGGGAKVKGGMINPMLAKADFSLQGHPYQAFYLPPREQEVHTHQQDMGGGMSGSMGAGFGNGFAGQGFEGGWGKYDG